jgi:hypothetical protein
VRQCALQKPGVTRELADPFLGPFHTGDSVDGDREYMASSEGFHTVHIDVKSPVDRNAVAFPLLSPEDRETEGRQQNHSVICELSDGRQSAWRLEAYTCELSQRICKLSCI